MARPFETSYSSRLQCSVKEGGLATPMSDEGLPPPKGPWPCPVHMKNVEVHQSSINNTTDLPPGLVTTQRRTSLTGLRSRTEMLSVRGGQSPAPSIIGASHCSPDRRKGRRDRKNSDCSIEQSIRGRSGLESPLRATSPRTDSPRRSSLRPPAASVRGPSEGGARAPSPEKTEPELVTLKRVASFVFGDAPSAAPDDEKQSGVESKTINSPPGEKKKGWFTSGPPPEEKKKGWFTAGPPPEEKKEEKEGTQDSSANAASAAPIPEHIHSTMPQGAPTDLLNQVLGQWMQQQMQALLGNQPGHPLAQQLVGAPAPPPPSSGLQASHEAPPPSAPAPQRGSQAVWPDEEPRAGPHRKGLGVSCGTPGCRREGYVHVMGHHETRPLCPQCFLRVCPDPLATPLGSLPPHDAIAGPPVRPLRSPSPVTAHTTPAPRKVRRELQTQQDRRSTVPVHLAPRAPPAEVGSPVGSISESRSLTVAEPPASPFHAVGKRQTKPADAVDAFARCLVANGVPQHAVEVFRSAGIDAGTGEKLTAADIGPGGSLQVPHGARRAVLEALDAIWPRRAAPKKGAPSPPPLPPEQLPEEIHREEAKKKTLPHVYIQQPAQPQSQQHPRPPRPQSPPQRQPQKQSTEEEEELLRVRELEQELSNVRKERDSSAAELREVQAAREEKVRMLRADPCKTTGLLWHGDWNEGVSSFRFRPRKVDQWMERLPQGAMVQWSERMTVGPLPAHEDICAFVDARGHAVVLGAVNQCLLCVVDGHHQGPVVGLRQEPTRSGARRLLLLFDGPASVPHAERERELLLQPGVARAIIHRVAGVADSADVPHFLWSLLEKAALLRPPEERHQILPPPETTQSNPTPTPSVSLEPEDRISPPQRCETLPMGTRGLEVAQPGPQFEAIVRDLVADRIDRLPRLSPSILQSRSGLLAKALSANTSLTECDLSDLDLGDETVARFLRALRRHPSIKELKIARNEAAAEAANELAAFSDSPPPQLRLLDLSGNDFDSSSRLETPGLGLRSRSPSPQLLEVSLLKLTQQRSNVSVVGLDSRVNVPSVCMSTNWLGQSALNRGVASGEKNLLSASDTGTSLWANKVSRGVIEDVGGTFESRTCG
eukprot:Hpha_TRINITY_DN12962_c0_g1::TRINITY_DN12962_c0_g1_i1::g.164603::m.164603